MQAAEAGEFGGLQAGDGGEQALLFAVGHLGLEADHVVERAQGIVLAQLDDGGGLVLRVMGVGQADRLHRPIRQCLAAPFGHHLDRQAAFEVGRVRLPLLEVHSLGFQKRINKCLELLAAERAVDVVRAGALVVAGLEPGLVEIDAVFVDDRGNGIEKGQGLGAGQLADAVGQAGRGQRAGGDDQRRLAEAVQVGDFPAVD